MESFSEKKKVGNGSIRELELFYIREARHLDRMRPAENKDKLTTRYPGVFGPCSACGCEV